MSDSDHKLNEELREKIAKALGVPFVPVSAEAERCFKEMLQKKLTEVFGVEGIPLEGAGDLFSTIAAGHEVRARRAEEAAGITLDVWDDPEPEWLSDVMLPPLVHVVYPVPYDEIEICP